MKKLLLAGALLALGVSTAYAQLRPIGVEACARKACVYWVVFSAQQGSCSNSAVQRQPVGSSCACLVRTKGSPALGSPGIRYYQGFVACRQRTTVRRPG
jgi:hypothetical protein